MCQIIFPHSQIEQVSQGFKLCLNWIEQSNQGNNLAPEKVYLIAIAQEWLVSIFCEISIIQ